MWFFLSFFGAFTDSILNATRKKGLAKLDPYTFCFFESVACVILMSPVLFLFPIPKLQTGFWLIFIAYSLLNLVATILQYYALKISDMSASVPMMAFSPLFMLLTSPLILGEYPGFLGTMGILAITAGSYFLNLSAFKQGWLAPFKALFKEKGPLLMLIVAFIFSIVGNLEKAGMQKSALPFWMLSVQVGICLLMIPFAARRLPESRPHLSSNIKYFILAAVIAVATYVCILSAMNLTLAPYVIAIKRTSIVMSVIWGGLFFNEKSIKERLLGSAVMAAGVALIALGDLW